VRWATMSCHFIKESAPRPAAARQPSLRP
jgi:hypothetical protein